MLTRNRRRAAFTLVELLVVVSIIAVLVALTATAAFGVRNGMSKQNSEVTLQKIDTKIRDRVKSIRDQINDDIKNNRTQNEYNAASGLTGNVEGAKAIMLYARLKQQLPMSITEAQSPFVVNGYNYPSSPAFKGLNPNPGGATLEQSAACLYAAVAAMGSLDGLEQQVGTSPNGYKVFVDGFGQPIAFIRLAFDGNAGELNNSPFTKSPNQDPFDPDGKAAGVLTSTPALWTTFLGPQLTDAGAYSYPTTYRATNRNHAIAIFSAGQNKKYYEVPASSGLFDDADNLFGYRLREGRHGD